MMQIPTKVITKLKLLLEDNVGKIIINNNIIGHISIDSGIGQGDSNSCLLYNIATIPIALALSKSTSIKEIDLENKPAKSDRIKTRK